MITRDVKREEFTATLPCAECKYNIICKHYGEIEPPGTLPTFIKVQYTCTYKEQFEAGSALFLEKQ